MTSHDSPASIQGGTWLRAGEGEPITPMPGVSLWTMSGEHVMFAFVQLEPNAEVPAHAHPNEQTGTVVEGLLHFTMGGETHAVQKGEAYLIPADVSHSAVAGDEGSLVVEVFSPPRENYRMQQP